MIDSKGNEIWLYDWVDVSDPKENTSIIQGHIEEMVLQPDGNYSSLKIVDDENHSFLFTSDLGMLLEKIQ